MVQLLKTQMFLSRASGSNFQKLAAKKLLKEKNDETIIQLDVEDFARGTFVGSFSMPGGGRNHVRKLPEWRVTFSWNRHG